MQRESARIAEARLKVVAIDSEIDAPQAKSNLARTLAAIEALEIARRQHQNRLCVLLGMPPQDLERSARGDEAGSCRSRKRGGRHSGRTAAVAGPTCGVPSVWLPHFSAEIGVAQANLYPRIALNGTLAYEAAQFPNLFDTGALSGTVGPSFRWNVLNYGRLLHNVRVQDARFQQQVAVYQQTVLRANEEAENAIVAFLRYHDQLKLLEQSVQDAQEAVRVAQAKYRAGRIDFNRVFTVEQLLITQQDQLATAQGNLALSLIELYRSLGGGWQIRLESAANE